MERFPLLARLLRRDSWVRRVLVAGFWVGSLGALWLGVTAIESWLFYQSIGREPYRTSHLRIAAKKTVSAVLNPIYDHRLIDEGDLPAYELRLSEKRLDQWHGIMQRVYARGWAEEEDQVYLPGVFRHRDLEVEVDVRGRGTLFTHYKVDKPSFRVRFPKDHYFRGGRVTNLIIPYDQARVVGDTSINSLARRYGLITLPTRFVTLKLNDEVLGVYHEVEHFRKELAVKQFRSEGYFMSSLGEPKGGAAAEDHPGFAVALKAFSACVVTPCDEAAARRVLDEYVDFDKMALYAGITTLFGAKHGWGEDNLMLFFDPPRGRFEPVPWDMGTLRLGRGEDPFHGLESVKGIGSAFLRFEDFRRQRDRYVWDVLSRHRRATLEESERLYGDIRRALSWDTEHSRRYTQRMVDYFQGALRHNFDLWQEHLEAVDLEMRRTEDGVEWINRAAATVRVELEGAQSGDVGSGDAEVLFVPGRYLDEPGRLSWTVDPEEAERASLHNEITGAEISWDAVRRSAEPIDALDPAPPTTIPGTTIPATERTEPPPGVRLAGGADDPVWVFAGRVRIDETTAVPDGVRVRFEPGLDLVLGPDVSLIIHGDLSSVGTADAPIRIGPESLDAPYRVLAVLGRSHRKALVRLEHTVIRGGTEDLFRGSYFTGMFSVYDGHLLMRHSRIEDVLGEDGLNVKFGFVEFRDNVIERTFSDAVDLDFCRGVMENNVIRGAGGDSLDFSGSLIEARDNLLENTNDKGLSIGEATTAWVVENRIVGATTGVASKDSSWVVVEPGPTEGLTIGTSVYQKKQTFDSGIAVLAGEMDGASTRFLGDPKAWIHRLSSPGSSDGER